MAFTKQFKKYIRNLGKNLVKGGYLLKGEMQNTVAIDTGDLRDDINTSPLNITGSILKVSVGTENIKYAPFVEEGVQGKIYKYHRREGIERPVVHVGVGMQYMERSVEKTKGSILNLLKSTKK